MVIFAYQRTLKEAEQCRSRDDKPCVRVTQKLRAENLSGRDVFSRIRTLVPQGTSAQKMYCQSKSAPIQFLKLLTKRIALFENLITPTYISLPIFPFKTKFFPKLNFKFDEF